MTIEEFAGSYLLPIAAASFIAWLVHRLGRVFVRRFVRLGDIAPVSMRLREERRRTLQDLFASMVSFTAFLGAIIFSLALFVDADTLVWLVGLFSAGIGFGARPLISDWLTGIGFIFEDTFGIGEKVEIMGVEGVIEQINLRTTTLRAPNGELYVIPNGEIRVIRNFSRAQYSTANITVKRSPDETLVWVTDMPTADPVVGNKTRVSVSYSALPSEVNAGDRILLADGLLELSVTGTGPADIRCQVVIGGWLTAHKGPEASGDIRPGFFERGFERGGLHRPQGVVDFRAIRVIGIVEALEVDPGHRRFDHPVEVDDRAIGLHRDVGYRRLHLMRGRASRERQKKKG